MDDVYRDRDVWPFNPPSLTPGFDDRFWFSHLSFFLLLFLILCYWW